ncbi:MAG: ribosome maturation factor RimP [Thermodesulfovibrionales bacterium]|nr:ribosome maturation factor RimP [Thermodesulfovibrionales bacterium]
MAGLQDRIREIVEEAALAHGLEVDDAKLSGREMKMLLRVTIDKPGGVTLGDCEALSRDIAAMLDVEDPIKSRYTLEVSSPGLDRPLRNPKDFMKQTGKLVRLVTKENVGGRSFFIGQLVSASERGVVLSVDGEEIGIDFDNISKARLEIEIK